MTEQISEFLLALDLSQHVPAFVENDVEMDLLPSLSDADLRDLGVDKLGHRKRILAAAAALGTTEGPADGTSARAEAASNAHVRRSCRIDRALDAPEPRGLSRDDQGLSGCGQRGGGELRRFRGEVSR